MRPASSSSSEGPTSVLPALPPADRATILAFAREVVDAAVRGRPSPSPPALAALAHSGGAFVTLYRQGRLRGCIGLVASALPRGEVLRRMGGAAALEDPRFPPVAVDELRQIDVSVSLMGDSIRCDPDEVVVGRDGVVLEHREGRGLLLPEVAVEHGLGREAFLDALCDKAGVRRGAWREPGVLRRFETIHLP